LTSQYGSILGVPVAAGGAIWALLVFMLAAFGLKEPKSETASLVAGYIFVLSTLGLATVFYFGYVSFFVLKTACPLCMTMYVSVIGTFLLSAGAAGPIAALPSRLGRDIATLVRNPLPATLAVVWLAASAALILGFPKAPEASQTSAGSSATPSSAPVETLTAEQRAEWEAWLDAQPRKPEAQPTGATKVLVLKFNDYQCPSCRLAWILYKDIIAKYEKANPGVFMFENRDYPLETECGAGNAGHVAACEAAAAVRMAREKSRHQELEAALFERQSPTMTRDDVVSALQQVAQISKADFDSKYSKTLESVRADVQLGQKLGVTGTPTFFLNGIQLPSLRPAYFDAAIDWALRRFNTASSGA
jgi:protein-disulfide isomerase